MKRAPAFIWSFLLLLPILAKAQHLESVLGLAEKESIRFHTQPGVESTFANGANIDVKHYRAYWHINPDNDSIRGKVAIVFSPRDAAVNQFTLDLASNLLVESVRFRENAAVHSFSGPATLSINLGAAGLAPGETDSVVIRYRGRPNSSVFGSWSRVLHNGVPVIYTLSEPYGAKDWWPSKMAMVDKADSVAITLYTPEFHRGVSNGLITSETVQNGIRTTTWKHKYPITTYLIAIAVTNYAHFRLKAPVSNGDTIPIDNYCYPESLPAWQSGMPSIVQQIQDFDTLLGPYPFAKEKYGHCEFAFGGGMEHQTISFMQNTDYGLQAHELVHHWFGNMVTCGSWQDIWLNEGFATFFAAYEVDQAGISSWKAQGGEWIDFITQVPDGSVFCTDTTDLYRIFSGRFSYLKGAMLLRMLRYKLGETAFWNALRAYLNDPILKHAHARTRDLKRHLEQASGQNLDAFFQDWFFGQGWPSFQIQFQPQGNGAQLLISQSSSHPSVPLFRADVPLLFRNGNQEALRIISVQENNQTVSLDLPFTPTELVFNPNNDLMARGSVSQVTALDPLRNQAGVSFYPNPASEQITVFGFEGSRKVRVLDLSGKVVSTFGWLRAGESISIADLPSGCYLLETESQNVRKRYKFFRE